MVNENERQALNDDDAFLGRLDEQERFRSVLIQSVEKNSILTRLKDYFFNRSEASDSPFILLISGEGGIGKSQLTRRLHHILTHEKPFTRKVQSLYINWELVTRLLQ